MRAVDPAPERETTMNGANERKITALKCEANKAGDYKQAVICQIALGEIEDFDGDDWSGGGWMTTADRRELESMTRDEAIEICLAVIDAAAANE